MKARDINPSVRARKKNPGYRFEGVKFYVNGIPFYGWGKTDGEGGVTVLRLACDVENGFNSSPGYGCFRKRVFPDAPHMDILDVQDFVRNHLIAGVADFLAARERRWGTEGEDECLSEESWWGEQMRRLECEPRDETEYVPMNVTIFEPPTYKDIAQGGLDALFDGFLDAIAADPELNHNQFESEWSMPDKQTYLDIRQALIPWAREQRPSMFYPADEKTLTIEDWAERGVTVDAEGKVLSYSGWCATCKDYAAVDCMVCGGPAHNKEHVDCWLCKGKGWHDCPTCTDFVPEGQTAGELILLRGRPPVK